MPLTIYTQIPTHARGKVRALVKAHPEWRIFLEAKEIISANAKNKDLLEFALFHPELTSQIESLIDETHTEIDTAPIAQPPTEETIGIIERLLREFYAQQQKPRIRVPARTVTV